MKCKYNAQVLYDSVSNNTKKLLPYFDYPCEKVSSKTKLLSDLVVFICPTYGDEELPHSMEDFLINLKVKNKNYVVCELGNYYGFDDFSFGAKKIIEQKLLNLGWKKFYNSLSLDSVPKINWNSFFSWKTNLDYAIQNRCKK